MVIPVGFFLDLLNLQIIMQCINGSFEIVDLLFKFWILLSNISIFFMENLVLFELGFQYLVEVKRLVTIH